VKLLLGLTERETTSKVSPDPAGTKANYHRFFGIYSLNSHVHYIPVHPPFRHIFHPYIWNNASFTKEGCRMWKNTAAATAISAYPRNGMRERSPTCTCLRDGLPKNSKSDTNAFSTGTRPLSAATGKASLHALFRRIPPDRLPEPC
jgi:hypothetical protein